MAREKVERKEIEKEKKTYGVTSGLKFNTHEVQEVHEVIQLPKKEIGNTQGKKGMKLKRINMAFSDDNHDYITRKSRQMGISATAFVNLIIEQYNNLTTHR